MINFSCTQCGQCCSQPPQFNFFELLTLSDKFVFLLTHNAIFSTEKNLPTQNNLKHYQKIAHTIVLPEFNASLFYYVSFSALQLKSYKSCQHLNNNLCNIYSQRPNFCKLLPAIANQSILEQEKPILFFKNKVASKEWACDFETNEFYTGEEFQNHNLNLTFYKEAAAYKETTNIYVDFLNSISEQHKNLLFKNVFNALETKTTLTSDVITLFIALKNNGILQVEQFIFFLKNQVLLMQKETQKSIDNKNKEDLIITKQYKNLIFKYQKIIDNPRLLEENIINTQSF